MARARSAGHGRAVVALGGAITLLVTGAELFDAFELAEGRALDLRFEHAPRKAAPMHGDIVFVDIDDGALGIGGRWPWPRETLAGAVTEVARAGARSIVLDLLFIEPETAADGSDPSPGDLALREAIAAAPAALAVEMGDEDSRRFQRGELLGPHTQRMLVEQRELRDFVRRSGRFPELVEFVAAREPRAGVSLSRQDRVILRTVHEQARSWQALAPRFVGGPGGSADFARAPILVLAEVAKAAGFVNFTPDGDGGVRALDATRWVPDGRALQLGLAAAALHLGVDPATIQVGEDSIQIGAVRLPLHESEREGVPVARLWLSWPTPSPALSGGSESRPEWVRCAPRYSLGRPLATAQSERNVVEQAARRDHLAAEIAADFGIAGEGDERLAAVREESRFRLEDAAAAAAAGGLSEEEDLEIAPFRAFAAFEDEIERGRREIEAHRAEMAEALGGKLVFIGWTATGAASDFVLTPLSARTPGVMAHAVAADMVLQGRALRFAPGWAGAALALLLGALATGASVLPLLGSALGCAAVLGGYAAAAFLAFGRNGYVLPLVAPLWSGALAWVGTTALQAALAQRDRRRITRQFKARVGGELVDWLVDHPDALSMSGEPREVAAFFLDLAGFTATAERLGATQTVAILNECMSVATEALTRHHAYVNKFLGDGVMAFWSAFRADPEQATHACEAALAVQEALGRVVDRKLISARVGIATGRVIVGDCGAPPQLHDYTAIGDAINLAARLESANKQLGTRILVDGRTREQVRDPSVRFRYCGRVGVVGQATPTDLYEVLSEAVAPEEVAATEAAVESFRAGRLAECAQRFRQFEERYGISKLARTYLAAVEEIAARGGGEFDGVLRLVSK